MEIPERKLFTYYENWLQIHCGKRSGLSTYDKINNAYEKVFEKERDVPIDEAEELLYIEFEKKFSQVEWDRKEAERLAEEEKERQIAEKLKIDKANFHDRLWHLTPHITRNIKRFRDNQVKENALRTVPKSDFYIEDNWLILKKFATNLFGQVCMSCGTSPAKQENVEMQVDHILPGSKYPELKLDIENMQMLCKACNHEKRNFVNTDFRKKSDIELVKSLYLMNWEKVVKIYKINDEKQSD